MQTPQTTYFNEQVEMPYDGHPKKHKISHVGTSSLSSHDFLYYLANKACSELVDLVRFLERSDPDMLKNSHLTTAHFLCNNFLETLQKRASLQGASRLQGIFQRPANMSSFQLPSQKISGTISTTPINCSPTQETMSDHNPSNMSMVPNPYKEQTPLFKENTLKPLHMLPAPPQQQTIPSMTFPPVMKKLAMFQPFTPLPDYENSTSLDLSKESLSNFEQMEILGAGNFGKVRLV